MGLYGNLSIILNNDFLQKKELYSRIQKTQETMRYIASCSNMHERFRDFENQLFKNNEEIIPDYKILPNARTSDTSGEHNIYKRPFLQLSAIRTNFT